MVVVGAGIAGLTHAWRRIGSGDDVTLIEASDRPGGVVRSLRVDGMLLEQGPQSLLASHRPTVELLDALGLLGQVVEAAPAAHRRYLLRGTGLQALPTGPADLLLRPPIACGGIARAFLEPFLPARPQEGETVHAFVARRLGLAVADGLVDPFVAGVFGGDPRRLELASAFPAWEAAEREHGSLIRAAFRRPARPPAPAGAPKTLYTLRDGLETLVRRLAERIGPRLRRSCPASSVARHGAGWRVETSEGTLEADEVVLACPAPVAGTLLGADLPTAPCAPVAAVHLAFDPSDVPSGLDGFGWLAPSDARTDVLGCLWVSSAFPGHAPGRALLRVMIGGVRAPELADQPEDALVAHARRVLSEVQGITAPPLLAQASVHRPGIPQYPPGHARALAAAGAPGLRLLGWWWTGIGVSACVEAALAESSG